MNPDYYYKKQLLNEFPIEKGCFYKYVPVTTTYGSPRLPENFNVFCVDVVDNTETIYAKFLVDAQIVKVSPIFFQDLKKQTE